MDIYRWRAYDSPNGGIQSWEIEDMRNKVSVGDVIKIEVPDALDSDIAKSHCKTEICKVDGKYHNLIVLRRKCGLKISKTYVELIQEGVSKI